MRDPWYLSDGVLPTCSSASWHVSTMNPLLLPASASSLQSVARILSHVALCVSDLDMALPPPLLPHSSALLALLNLLLSNFPNFLCPVDPPPHDRPPHDLYLNTLQQLDVLRGLLGVSQSLRSLLLALAQRYSDLPLPREGLTCEDSGEDEKERLFLLGLFGDCSKSGRSNVRRKIPKSGEPPGDETPPSVTASRRRCFERLSIRRMVWSSRKAQRTESDEIDGSAFANSCIEAVSVLDKNLHLLRSTLQAFSRKLSSTAESLRDIFLSDQLRPSFVPSALLRKTLSSFLRYDVEFEKASQEVCSSAQDIDDSILLGKKLLAGEVDDLIGKLLNPRGPPVICICGGSGVGKTSLATLVASDKRIEGNFPGGTYMLSVGREPDLISLQALLWSKITRTKTTFASVEEGTAALTNRFSEGLPALLVLDDVWNPSHLMPFMCFDGTEKGRLLVISETGKAVDPTGEAFVHFLGPLEQHEAVSLVLSISPCTTQSSVEKVSIVEALARNCMGVPRLIQAVASIVYDDEGAFLLPSIANLAKDKALLIQVAHEDAAELLDSAAFEGESEKGKSEEESTEQDACAKPLVEIGKKDRLHVSKNASPVALLPLFDALGEVHPLLQECFLDLAAFPKNQWVSFSTLVDIWGVGDGMEEETIVLVLGLLVSRSVIDWKVEVGVDVVNQVTFSDQSRLLQMRLAGEFYELAQTIIEMTVGEVSASGGERESTAECEDWKDKEKRRGLKAENSAEKTHSDAYEHVLGMFEALQSAIDGMDTVAGLVCADEKTPSQHFYPGLRFQAHGHDNTCIVPDDTQGQSLRKEKQLFKSNTGVITSRSSRSHLFGVRLFIPGSSFKECPMERSLSKKATKLSVVCGDVVEVSSGMCFSSLKVALMSSNERLKSISSTAMKHMEQLVVLDLKYCRLLTLLPKSISMLHSLELLDLSYCTHLISLPNSTGKLKKLRTLRLSSCLSLSSLPKSLGDLSGLVMLDLSMCVRLKRLPETIGNLFALQNLNLFGCYSLHSLPASIVSLRKLNVLELSGCCNLSYSLPWFEQIKLLIGLQKCSAMAIPFNIWKLGLVESLHLCSLKNLTYLPRSVGKLQHLLHLNLSSCRSLEYLPDDLCSLHLLQNLDLSHTAIRMLPNTLGQLSCLVFLCLRGCSRLMCIPSSVSSLPKLVTLDMAECWDFATVPTDIGLANSLPELLELDLSGCSVKQLPYFSPRALAKLQKLHLSGCQSLASLPETFGMLTSLERIDFDGCKSLASLHGVGFEKLKHLSWLNLRNCCSLKSLPVLELEGLESLKFIDVSGCSELNPFPEPLLSSAREHRFTLIRWGAVWH